MKVQVKKITAVLTAVIMAAVMLCCFGSRALPNRLKITFAAEDPAAEYGAVGVVRVTVQAENPVDVDWSIAWTDESETLPIENYFKIRPISHDTSMTVDVICRSYTESEAELSAWIHGAPHTKITKKLTAPLVREEVADGIDSIDMPAVTDSLHPLFPSCETALAIVKLTNDMILSANTSGSAKDGFLRLVSQTGRRYYDFELADPGALDGAVTLEDVVSTLYVVLDPTYHGYFRALQWLPIEGAKRYRDGKSEIISGIQLFQEKTALRISFTGELTAEEERNFFAAMEIPVLCDDYFYTWDGKKDSGLRGNASELSRRDFTTDRETSGSYRLTAREDGLFTFTSVSNARCVRAGGKFPQIFTIRTSQEESGGSAYLGDKLFLDVSAIPENTNVFANGHTYSFVFNSRSSSVLSNDNETGISGDRASFRRVFARYLVSAAKKYASEHGVYPASSRFETVYMNELERFELLGDITIHVGSVQGYDSALVGEIVDQAAAYVNNLFSVQGKEHSVNVQQDVFSSCSELEAAKSSGKIDLWLERYEDHAQGTLKYYERYYDGNPLGIPFLEELASNPVTRDPFWWDPGWYDWTLPLFSETGEEFTIKESFEELLYDLALDVPVLMGQDVYLFSDETERGCGGAYVTCYRGFFDLIAQGWSFGDQRFDRIYYEPIPSGGTDPGSDWDDPEVLDPFA